MTIVWNKISKLAEDIASRFNSTGTRTNEDLNANYNWHNALWTSSKYRRAHVEIVDFRKTHNIYILHSTVFPHVLDSSPIWGFDAVCGANKITGAFHDFSLVTSHEHDMYLWFKNMASTLTWNKPRKLPEWASAIFSPSIIAAGNLQEEVEIDQLCATALSALDYYLNCVGALTTTNYQSQQNRYCHYQKQNPHVIRSMVSMGVNEDTMKQFVDDVLFPEIT